MAAFNSETSQAAEIDERNTAVVINVDDPLSVRIGNYYVSKRMIPEKNIIRIKMGSKKNILSPDEFKVVAKDILQQTREYIQAYALAWTTPYRVGCMSMTSAISLGFNRVYCAEGCHPTKVSGFFNSPGKRPFSEHKFRPSMMLAASTFEEARRLIDRGVNSDYSRPEGDVYLVSTSDRERNVRSIHYDQIAESLGNVLNINIVNSDYIKSKKNVLFYFTGTKQVEYLDSVKFLPGAVADHLTSTGGVLSGSSQMSSMEWLKAGTTASYGAVVEPCNYLAKFPSPGVLMQHYLNGDTVLEAYWKSVAMPGQGVFIGEPLASPFKGCRLGFSQAGKAVKMVNANQSFLALRESTRCVSGEAGQM